MTQLTMCTLSLRLSTEYYLQSKDRLYHKNCQGTKLCTIIFHYNVHYSGVTAEAEFTALQQSLTMV